MPKGKTHHLNKLPAPLVGAAIVVIMVIVIFAVIKGILFLVAHWL